MKIFQGTIEIAGQMGILSGELKKRGHLASGYNIFHSYLGYKDHLVNTNSHEIQTTYKHIINFFDLFHFHYASSLLPDYKDLEIIRGKGKKMIMHHWGNDIRFHDLARINNPYVYTGDSPGNEVIHHRLTAISQYVDEAIVQDYEVYTYARPYYKKVHVVPISIDLSRFIPSSPKKDVKRPLILHAPTNPDFKGTLAIEEAIHHLQKSYNFEYRRIQHLNHEEAVKLYREADLIIDQIRCGSYGLLSVEAMALGKPVLAFIRSDVAARFPSQLPVVNANPDNITSAIQLLLENPSLRLEMGEHGREYAEKYHAKEVVVDLLEQIYGNLRS
ncbi:glycosyltransferase family 4 protein [Paenibacillus sp. N3.4]|uniref:glycosyltransferase family 4 protein n=1 Tax=Paenibacillus sp. N3.4 TaxID=2603222 RepID=UPI0011C8E9E8|nr:glycosyltransferase family 4 protein [Paenibacillus sp. N3.4]TXK84645.1 glycosyltransferase family 4 protein [Paenibacillus sp. N3.4]